MCIIWNKTIYINISHVTPNTSIKLNFLHVFSSALQLRYILRLNNIAICDTSGKHGDIILNCCGLLIRQIDKIIELRILSLIAFQIRTSI